MIRIRNRYVVFWTVTVALAAAWGAFSSGAAETTLAQARAAAGSWVRRTPPFGAKIGPDFLSARTVKDAAGTTLFHVVRFKEGGFVVMAADDGVLPVIAFSGDDDLVEDERNPLWVLLNRDLPQRLALSRKAVLQQVGAQTASAVAEYGAQWRDLLSDDGLTTSGLSSVEDLRVAPLLATRWNQSTVDNVPGGLACYNYYTPPYEAGASSNDVCGCVATAGAQLMRYHQYPTASVTAESHKIWVDGVSRQARMIGGTYAWSDMPEEPSASTITLAQRQAIGTLTYDVGVASHMAYTADGSGVSDCNLVTALNDTFGYASALVIVNPDSGVDGYLDTAALANLDAKCPVLFGISGEYGHEVVGDGYGYSGGARYVHLNMGWSGWYNAWYNLPTVNAYYTFTMLDSIIFNVFPTAQGEVISGRVLDPAGNPLGGVSVVATNQVTLAGLAVTTDDRGIYAFLVPSAGTYRITAGAGWRSATTTATVSSSVSTTYHFDPASGETAYSPGTGSVGNSWGNDLTLPDPVPDAPATVNADDGTSTSLVTVSWSAASYATGYGVYRSTSDSSGTAGLLGYVTGTEYDDATTTPGALYYYWVTATNGSGSSAFSASDAGYRALAAPPDVAASDSSTGAVTVTWGSVAGASYYRVYRAAASTGAKDALGDWQTTLAYSDTTAAVGATNYYWVAAAVDGSGTRAGAYSDYDTGVRLAPYTVTTGEPVPFAWLDTYGLVTGGDYEAAAQTDTDGDGEAAWKEYVAGTVPTNAASVFMALVAVSNNIPVVTWSPDLGAARVYTIEGKSALTNADWLTPTNAASRFFRVKVSTE